MPESTHSIELLLPKSRLRVRSGIFSRFANDGGVIAEVPLQDVEEMEIHRPFDPVTISIGAAAWIFGAVAFFYAQAEVIRWGVASLGVCIGMICMMAQRKNQIRIATRGEHLLFDFADTPEDARAFVFSVRRRISESGASLPLGETRVMQDESRSISS